MGPLFQLIFVLIVYLVFSVILGGILSFLLFTAAHLFNKNKQAAFEGFWLFFKLAPYFLVALICTAFISTKIRGVTPPLVDYWSFELGAGVTMGAIDTTETWDIWPSPEGGEAILSHIDKFNVDKNRVYGKTETGLNFIYILPPESELKTFTNIKFKEILVENGWTEEGMKKPLDYYYDNRLYGDLITLFLILAYPLFRLFKIFKLFFTKE